MVQLGVDMDGFGQGLQKSVGNRLAGGRVKVTIGGHVPTATAALGAVVNSCAHVKALQLLPAFGLARNGIGDRGAERLAKALKQNGSVTFCDIARNSVGDQGMDAIGRALLDNRMSKLGALKCDAFELQADDATLDLSTKAISTAAAALLAGVLSANGSLMTVSWALAHDHSLPCTNGQKILYAGQPGWVCSSC